MVTATVRCNTESEQVAVEGLNLINDTKLRDMIDDTSLSCQVVSDIVENDD